MLSLLRFQFDALAGPQVTFCQVLCLQQAAMATTASVMLPDDGSTLRRQSTLSENYSPISAASSVRGSDSRPMSGSFTVSSGGGVQSRHSVDFAARPAAPLIAVQTLHETTEAALPGVFTATLKVMIDVDAQPALESLSLDQTIINLLSCFAKCYGKGEAQNRRGIIRFAASKVTKFRAFVTLRFSVATRALSYINKPLSLCIDRNFW